MASYHFRIKSDKKSDGTRVSASVHVDYISRQGQYKNEGGDKIQESNSITFADKNIFDDSFPLYLSDDFGKIYNTEKGLQVSGKYSATTLSIALTLAKNISDNQPLIIFGSQKFKDKILAVAVDNELDITFADELLQSKFQTLLEMKKNDERKFKQDGGKIFYSRTIPKSNFKKFDFRSISDVAERGLNLQNVSAKSVANAVASSATDVFLSPDELSKLVEVGKQSYSRLRWNLSSEQRNLAELTSKKILENLEELRTQVSATSHFEYINREKKFASRGDCIFTHHHLPSWANDNPKNFFKAADKYEGKNRRRYVEIEFSLPNELNSVDDYRKIIDKFIDHHLKDHYYTYAIHDKLGAFSGERHPHVHIMFSDRLIDDVEKIQEREPQNFFKRAILKKPDGTEPTFQEKFLHGSPKEPKWNENPKNSNFIIQIREDFAKIQNEVLAEKGFSVRVSHKSLKNQKADAEKNGDHLLAKILDRSPEKYLSNIQLNYDCQQVEELKKSRTERKLQIQKLFADDFDLQSAQEKVLSKSISDFSIQLKIFTDLHSVLNSRGDDIKNLRTEIDELRKHITSLRRLLISTNDAQTQAKISYMRKNNQHNFQFFNKNVAVKNNLQQVLDTLPKPTETSEWKNYSNFVDNIQSQISNYDSWIKKYTPRINDIERNLKFLSQKNIDLATHNILKQNSPVRQELQIATQKLNAAYIKLHSLLVTDVIQNSSLDKNAKLQSLRSNLLRDKQNLELQRDNISKKIISLSRALKMAENIFVSGGFKKYRADLRAFEKHQHRLSSYDFMAQKKSLDDEFNRLTELCSTSQAKKKIAEIAVGILRKNQKISARLRLLNEQIKFVDLLIEKIPKPKITSKPVANNLQKNNSAPSLTSLVTDVLTEGSKDAAAIGQSANITDKDFEMDNGWNLMSELKKQEILRKRKRARY